jgi:hypothetical protein
VNLVNFMDGLDWMTVAEMVPLLGALTAFGLAGAKPRSPPSRAAAATVASAGRWPARPKAVRAPRWLLYRLAGEGGLAAAILLPLYYLADATLTLGRRALADQGHRPARRRQGKAGEQRQCEVEAEHCADDERHLFALPATRTNPA